METPFPWTCPYCDRPTTINSDNYWHDRAVFPSHAKLGVPKANGYILSVITCPNPTCRSSTLILDLVPTERRPIYDGGHSNHIVDDPIQRWQLIPPSEGRVFPDYVPQPVRDDYREACLIRELSPKASATLARRCLQGMIRDFWGIAKPKLQLEIDALKDKVDADAWEAIDSVRSIGNIGAHMEKDIDIIVEVDPGEAEKLIWLVETLIHDWYIVRHERKERLKEIKAMGNAKEKARKREPKAP